MRKAQQPLLEIKITGPDVKPGRIALSVLLKICREAQEAVNRQAEAIELKLTGKPITEAGIRQCRLELVGLRKGSTILDFAPASRQLSLLPEMEALGTEAVTTVATTLRAVNQRRGKWKPPDPRVLDALEELGSIFTEGVDRLQWIAPSHDRRKRTTADFVPAALPKIKRRKQEALPLQDSTKTTQTPIPQAPGLGVQESFLEGLLESAGGSVRITPQIGTSIVITYGADKAETVIEAIHKSVRVKVEGDKNSRKLIDLELTAPGLLDPAKFFEHKTIETLRAEQGAPPVTDLEALAGLIPEEDLEEFIADIYRDREA